MAPRAVRKIKSIDAANLQMANKVRAGALVPSDLQRLKRNDAA